MRKPNRIDAIIALVGPEVSGRGDGSEVHYHAGQTPPSESAIDAKLVKLEAEYDAKEYARNRKIEYNALNQFELISDDDVNGTTLHKEAIAAIKKKWPKDNSGPVE